MNDSASISTKDLWFSVFPKLAVITDAAWLSARDAAQILEFPAGTIMSPRGVQPGLYFARKGMRACLRAGTKWARNRSLSNTGGRDVPVNIGEPA